MMVFEAKGINIDFIENKDLNDIVEVYNSNRDFLVNHIDRDKITPEWVLRELESMKKADFYSCKIVEKRSGRLIGIMDFKLGKETYLSILMIHNDYKNKGFGSLIYQALEEYAKSEKSNSMRIDVVTNYDDRVLNFWSENGFQEFKEIELNWTGKVLPAVTMKKRL